MNMDTSRGLIGAYILDGKGGAEQITWERVKTWNSDGTTLWVHLDREDKDVQDWVLNEMKHDKILGEALLVDETRPRCVEYDDALMVILRGVNLNEGAEPDDMISIRMWIEKDFIITLRRPKLMAVQDIIQRLNQKKGPKNPEEFLIQITERLTNRLAPVVDDLFDKVDALEEDVIDSPANEVRYKLSDIRRTAIRLRRYLTPQREALTHLQSVKVNWISDNFYSHFRELNDRLLRYIEDIDEVRDRAALTQEELSGKISDSINRTMYMLAIVATIFLPLGLLTGLLGINVGGIPGTENNHAFIVVCTVLVIIVIAEVLILKKKKWF